MVDIALINHRFTHETQTIAQIFFPNSRFAFQDENDPRETPPGIYRLNSILNETGCTGEVYLNNERLAVYATPITACLSVKRTLMLALFHALKQVLDAYTPWGSLTGIRPSKLVRQWLNEGKNEETVIDDLVNIYMCGENKARLALDAAKAEERLSRRVDAMAAVPLGLYISVPFCPSRCLYCSFNTNDKPAVSETLDAYTAALLLECRQTAEKAREMNGMFTGVYIGGGTPTVLPEYLLDKLLNGITEIFSPLFTDDVEFTVEAGRPDTLNAAKIRIMRDYGVNRIAVNPQTLNDKTLRIMGRSHTVRDFYNAFEQVRKAGFKTINADVIAGLPDETPDDMRGTMDGLIKLSPENITVHTLAVKRASRLNEHLPDYPPPAPFIIEEMLTAAREACERARLSPYYLYRQKNMVGLFENTGYSRQGNECLYNVGMMAETQTVLAAGAGAVNKYVSGSRIERVFNVKNPEIYIERMMKREYA